MVISNKVNIVEFVLKSNQKYSCSMGNHNILSTLGFVKLPFLQPCFCLKLWAIFLTPPHPPLQNKKEEKHTVSLCNRRPPQAAPEKKNKHGKKTKNIQYQYLY